MLKKRVINKPETDRAYNARLLKNEDLYQHCEFCGGEYHEDDLTRGEVDCPLPAWLLCDDCYDIRHFDESELAELQESEAHKRIY